MFLQKLIFWIQAFWFRLVFFGCFVLVFGVFIYGGLSRTQVPKNWEEEYVPFVEEAQKTLEVDEKALPLDQANRSYGEMEEWISLAVSEAMTLSAKELNEKLVRLEGEYFSSAAFAEYKQALVDTNISGVVQQQNMKTSVYLESPPVLMNEGVAGGRYSWLYDVPLVITYVPDTVRDYTAGQDIENIPVSVRVQVGRIHDEEDAFAVRIDSWQLTGRKTRQAL